MDSIRIVIDDLFERGESAVVHVRRGEFDVAERRHLELSGVGTPAGCRLAAAIGEFGIEPVVLEQVVGEELVAVAMEAVGAEAPSGGIELEHKESQPALFFVGELRFVAHRAVELGISRNKSEKILLEREAEAPVGDFR